MKKLKILIFTMTLVFGTSIYAQSKDSLNTKHNSLKSLKFDFKKIITFKRMSG